MGNTTMTLSELKDQAAAAAENLRNLRRYL